MENRNFNEMVAYDFSNLDLQEKSNGNCFCDSYDSYNCDNCDAGGCDASSDCDGGSNCDSNA